MEKESDWRLHRAATTLGGWLLALACAGCLGYPDSSERFNDVVVVTAHAESIDFSRYKTFAIDPDVQVATVQQDGTVQMGTADPSVSATVIDRIATNLQQRGFQMKDKGETPDLGVSATAISGYKEGTVTGGYWYGYYGAYWGYPGYAYYYPYAVDYDYRSGSLILDMADLSSLNNRGNVASTTSGGLPVVWTSISYKAYIDNNVQSAGAAIDQAFEQSPYLRSE
jgi:uncharacterized protein DUF4136